MHSTRSTYVHWLNCIIVINYNCMKILNTVCMLIAFPLKDALHEIYLCPLTQLFTDSIALYSHWYPIKIKLIGVRSSSLHVLTDRTFLVALNHYQQTSLKMMENYHSALPLYTQWPMSSSQMYQAHQISTPGDNTAAHHTNALSYSHQQYHHQQCNVIRTQASELPVHNNPTKSCRDTINKTSANRPVHNIKPPYSYISLICMAIANTAEKKATLRDIIKYIESHFPYYRTNKKWHGSIRHNLTINDCFVKLPRRLGNRSCLWTIDPSFGDMFDNGSLRRRRYRFKDGTDGWNKAKLKNAMKQVNQHQKSSAAIDFEEEDGTSLLQESSNVSPASSPLSDQTPFSECSSSSWASTSGDLDEILQTIDSYDQQQASLNMCSTVDSGNTYLGFTQSDIISSAYHLSVNM